MDCPARLPVDCPRCENRGHIDLNDDVTLSCPLCNNWCSFCLEGVPMAENQHYRLRVTMLERKLLYGGSPKRVRSLFGRMDGSKRTVRRQQFKLGSCPVVVRRLFGRPAHPADHGW